jgi:monothiol glutaredoxin
MFMPRPTLDESRIHPAVRAFVAGWHASTLCEVQSAVATQPVVVLGMAQNPFVKKVRRALDAAGVAYTYIEHGGYLSQWRRRGAIKMWSGWPTFPMVFVKGTLIGGASELDKLVASGELKELLK